MERERILSIINSVLTKNRHAAITDEDISLRDAGFRSLDFSEVALRIEAEIDRELTFEASTMRRIASIKDAVDFFSSATRA